MDGSVCPGTRIARSGRLGPGEIPPGKNILPILELFSTKMDNIASENAGSLSGGTKKGPGRYAAFISSAMGFSTSGQNSLLLDQAMLKRSSINSFPVLGLFNVSAISDAFNQRLISKQVLLLFSSFNSAVITFNPASSNMTFGKMKLG